MSEYIVEVTDNNFVDEVINETRTVLVDFWASWCGPCLMVAPILEKVAEQLSGKLKVCKLNVDENRKMTSQFGVMSIPTLIIFRGGIEKDRIVGAIGEDQLIKKLKDYIV